MKRYKRLFETSFGATGIKLLKRDLKKYLPLNALKDLWFDGYYAHIPTNDFFVNGLVISVGTVKSKVDGKAKGLEILLNNCNEGNLQNIIKTGKIL